MTKDTIHDWTKENAEVNIRRWLIEKGLWAPGAEWWHSTEQAKDGPTTSTVEKDTAIEKSPTEGVDQHPQPSTEERAFASPQPKTPDTHS